MADPRGAAHRALDYESKCLHYQGVQGSVPPLPIMTNPSAAPDISTDQIVELARLYTRLRQSVDPVDRERNLRDLCWKLCFCHNGAVQEMTIQYSERWCRLAVGFFTTGDGTGRRIYLQLMIERLEGKNADQAEDLQDAANAASEATSEAARLYNEAQGFKARLRESEAARARERQRPASTSVGMQTAPEPAPEPAPAPAPESAQDALVCAGGCGRIVELTNFKGKRVLVESALQCSGCFALHLTADHPAPGWHCGACTADWRSVKRGRDPVCPDCLAR
jgi:hypothetical protein